MLYHSQVDIQSLQLIRFSKTFKVFENLGPATRIRFRTPRQMEAQANTTREQSNKNNIYDVGWRPSHRENGEGNIKKKNTL